MPDVYFTHTCPDGRTIDFVWDKDKDESNGGKHEVTFTEARRDKYIRIIGAGFWRDGQTQYDNSNRT